MAPHPIAVPLAWSPEVWNPIEAWQNCEGSFVIQKEAGENLISCHLLDSAVVPHDGEPWYRWLPDTVSRNTADAVDGAWKLIKSAARGIAHFFGDDEESDGEDDDGDDGDDREMPPPLKPVPGLSLAEGEVTAGVLGDVVMGLAGRSIHDSEEMVIDAEVDVDADKTGDTNMEMVVDMTSVKTLHFPRPHPVEIRFEHFDAFKPDTSLDSGRDSMQVCRYHVASGLLVFAMLAIVAMIYRSKYLRVKKSTTAFSYFAAAVAKDKKCRDLKYSDLDELAADEMIV